MDQRLMNPHKRNKILVVLLYLIIVISFVEISSPECKEQAIEKPGLSTHWEVLSIVVATNSLLTQSAVTEKECEACGMKVTTDDQWHFRITDGNGQMHYVECFMCALNLIKDYDTLHIETFCDWYGPNYRITVDSTEKGKQVRINPPSAMFLRTSLCEDNRVAYNQTAAEKLTANYSQFTSVFQRHDWHFEPTRMKVAESVNLNNNMGSRDIRYVLLPVLVGPIVAVLIDVGSLLYFRVKQRRAGTRYSFGAKSLDFFRFHFTS